MTTIEQVRKVIDTAVGPDRLALVKDTDLLVQGGIISSLEIVMIGLRLEQEFQFRIPDSQLTVVNFATLQTLSALVDRLKGKGGDSIQAGHAVKGYYWALQESLASCLRRPLVFVAMVLVWSLLLDFVVVPYLIERGPLSGMHGSFSDFGRRLYHSSGGWAPNDLRFAVRRHEFTRSPLTAGPSVLFFGDSGTIGSFVRAEDAPPAYTEARLRQTFPDARVYNFAFFMRSFTKDAMLLEAILESTEKRQPVDAVVFTFSDAYFHAGFQKHLVDAMPFFSLNRDLLIRFRNRIRPQDPAPYDNLYQYLANANRKFRGRFEEYVLERTSLYHYKTFFTFLTLYRKDPDAYWRNKEYAIGDTPLFPVRLDSPPANFQLHDSGFSTETLDSDQVALTEDVLNFLAAKNIKVYIFLRPYAPLEWKGLAFPADAMSIDTLIRDRGWDKKATVIDLRWSLYGNQFSDTLSHYTPEGSRILGDAIGGIIASTLKTTPESNAVASP